MPAWHLMLYFSDHGKVVYSMGKSRGRGGRGRGRGRRPGDAADESEEEYEGPTRNGGASISRT